MGLIVNLVYLCNPSPSDAQARLVVNDGETMHLGRVPQLVVTKEVGITNTGIDTLRITNVKTSCGCTTAPISRAVIEPGGSASLDVTIDTRTSADSISRELMIESNDVTRPIVRISLRAFVVRELVPAAEFFPVLERGVVGREEATTITIFNTGDTAVSISPMEPVAREDVGIRFELVNGERIAPGDSVQIRAYVRPLRSGLGNHRITVNTSATYTPELRLSIIWVAESTSESSSQPVAPARNR